MTVLSVQNLRAGYNKRVIIPDLTLSIDSGEFVTLIGGNGSGKSTIIKSLYGAAKVFSVEGIKVLNKPVSIGKFSETVIGKIAYVPQYDNTFDNLTVLENLTMSASVLKNHKKNSIHQMFDHFPFLMDRKNIEVSNLSGGQRQILAIAMALLHDPAMLIVDEPLAGLDPKSVKKIISVFEDIVKANSTSLLVVEHRFANLVSLTDRIIGLRNGKIVDEITEVSSYTVPQIKRQCEAIFFG